MHNIAIEFERAKIKFAQLPRKRQQKNGKNSLWQSHSLQLMVAWSVQLVGCGITLY
jgi:hypothetical protein